MKIKEIVSALERFAPLPLQDGFDNAGLQIGQMRKQQGLCCVLTLLKLSWMKLSRWGITSSYRIIL